jgi:iron complex outermembrane receptor protein
VITRQAHLVANPSKNTLAIGSDSGDFMTHTMRGLLATTATMAVLCQCSAFAQSAAPAPDATSAPAAQSTGTDSTGDIIVTAQRREQSLQKTPIAITALTTATLETRGVTNVMAVASATPGLYLSHGTSSPSSLQISMRGALEQNGGTITSESPVAIYIDDVYQSRLSSANYDVADIVRVEVLRGPQGTLYGRNSMTGAMKLVTRQPDGTTWLNADLSYARFNEGKIKVSLGTPITSHIALAASGFYDQRGDGWIYDIALGKHVGTFKHYGGQVALALTDVGNFEAVLTGRYVKSDSDGLYVQPINAVTLVPMTGFYETNTPQEALGNDTTKSVSLRLGYDFGGIKLRSITAYQTLDQVSGFDFSGGYVIPATGKLVAGDYTTIWAHQSQVTQEFQALGHALSERLHYIVGAFIYHEDARAHKLIELNAFGLTYPQDHLHTTSDSIAVYGQVDYEIIDGLTASAGLRYTHDKKNFDATTAAGPFGPVVPVSDKTKANVLTPRFNLQYQIDPHAMVYATVSRGYRAGGFNSLIVANPALFGKPYQPEFAWSYELGAKFDAFNRMLRVNTAAYYEKLSNLQTLAAVGGPSFAIQNAASATVKGIETEINLNPVKPLNLFATLAYTTDHYGTLDPATQAAKAGAKSLPLVSRWQGDFGGTYDFDLGRESSVQFAADYNYRSHYFAITTLVPSSFVPSVGRANLTITYKAPRDRWELYFQDSNVLGSHDLYTANAFITNVIAYRLVMEPSIWRFGARFKY